ncbi:glycosyltransferase family 9 protein [Candidatus Sumerlaeota bacterium]|nr:glycosyltransferase family 9 protein [Candidatus Sumerlaeota bacterium]
MRPKILIVKLSAMGDVVHALPALHALRKAFPGARIDWLIEEGASPLLKDHPLLNRVYVFQKTWRKNIFHHLFSDIIPFYKEIQREKFDWAIDFQGLTKSGLAAYFSGAREVIGFGDKDGREMNKLFTSIKIYPDFGMHIVEHNLCLLSPLGISHPEISFPLPDFKQELPEPFQGEYIVVNPGAGWVNKKLPLEILGRLCEMLFRETGWHIMIAWGPGEETIAASLAETIKKQGAEVRIAPRTTIPQLACLIRGARLFLGGDTGPTHLAAALNIPVLSWFGPSDSRRNAPYGSHCRAVQKFDIPCVPCWKTRCLYNDEKNLQCLKAITAEELFHEAMKLIGKKSP